MDDKNMKSLIALVFGIIPLQLLMPPSPLDGAKGIVFLRYPIIHSFMLVYTCMHLSVMFLRCLWYAYGMVWYALVDFHQTFDSSASWDKDELVRFWGQRVKGQGPSMAKYAKTTIFYFWVLFS